MIWTVGLGCAGLVVAVAIYSELAAPTIIEYSGRPLVDVDFFVRHERLGWALQPHLEYHLLDEATQEPVPYFTTGADGLRLTASGAGPLEPGIVLLVPCNERQFAIFDLFQFGVRWV